MIALLAAAALASNEALLAFAETRWRAQPETRIEDAYKWLFHATLGGDHAVRDPRVPRLWLDREWALLGVRRTRTAEVESLRPDGKVVRVHLRPYQARGGDKDMLLAVFTASAERFEPRRATFTDAWRALGRHLQHGPIGRITRKEWIRLDAATRPTYPAIHHSAEYEHTYRPAYRVVLGELWVPPAP